MLREPLVVILAFLILFVTVLIYVRLDFSISSSKAAASKGGNSAVVETVLRRHAKRAGVYETFDTQLSKLKSSKDVSAYQAALKNLTQEHKAETQAINDIITKARPESPELADSITELQKLDRGFWEVYIQYGQSLEKLVAGKMARPQFLEQDNQFNAKRDELAEKINKIIKTL